jgi:hypothetical protein
MDEMGATEAKFRIGAAFAIAVIYFFLLATGHI